MYLRICSLPIFIPTWSYEFGSIWVLIFFQFIFLFNSRYHTLLIMKSAYLKFWWSCSSCITLTYYFLLGANTRDPTPKKAIGETTWRARWIRFSGIFEKASSRDPTHDKVTRRKPDRQGRSGFQGFRKAASGSHLKDDTCLSDACLNGLWHRQEGLPWSLPKSESIYNFNQ